LGPGRVKRRGRLIAIEQVIRSRPLSAHARKPIQV
jgi:hypothetical protein